MAEPPAVSFAALLRQLRTSAGMTQEQLADRAGLSPRSISDLERGVHSTARQETIKLLVGAFGLTGSDQKAFEAAARGRLLASETPGPGSEAGGVAAATRTLPRDVSSFTGREPELDELIGTVTDHIRSGWVADIYAIGGMAGIGKTAFAVHAAHQLAPRFPDGQIFLPLHGHTPGQQPVDPTDALASLLQTAGVAAQQIPAGLEPRTRLWRDYLVGKQLLLLLDDAAGHEQVRPLLPGTAGSVVLVTSRRHLTALEDVQAISLDTLTPEAAAGLLISSAARPGLDAADRAVAEITRLCGYLPLAVGILGRQLHHHPAWTAAGLAADLGAAHHRLELMQAENVSVEAALDLSYQKLTGAQQRLFRRLGLHSGTDVDAYAAAALDGIDLAFARRHLDALYDQHLLIEPSRGRYRFHDLVGEYARERAAEDKPAECEAAVSRLVDYYLQAALAADRHQARRTAPGKPAAPGLPPAYVPALTDRESAVAWMDAERLNLSALVGYAAARARPRPAVAIATAMHGFMRLGELGVVQRLTTDYASAAATQEEALALYRALGYPHGEADALNDLGVILQATGKHPEAADHHRQALELYRHIGSRLGEAEALNNLGEWSLASATYADAASYYQQARDIARDVASSLEEARALEGLGRYQLQSGRETEAVELLSQSVAIYQRINSPNARRAETTLLDLRS